MSESDITCRYLSVAELDEALSSMVGMNNLSRAFNMQKSAGGSSMGLNICSIELCLLLKARCAKSEKKEIIKIIAEIVALNNISRRHGLMKLSDVVKELSCDFIKIGIQLVLDAFSPEIVKETMLKTLYTGNFKGVELLKRLIIIEGVLSIQCGDSNYNIKTKLFAFMGEKSLLETTQESPEIDNILDKYNPFRTESKQIDKAIKHASGPGNFNFVKCEFENFLKSDFIVHNLLSIFLFKNNEAFTPKIKVLNENTLDAIDRTLLEEVSYYEVETLNASEIKELAILIQSDFLNNKPRIVSAVNKVFNNNEAVHTDYRNLKIDEYETEIRSRIKEFFKVMLFYIIRRRILLRINHSIFNDIVNFTIVEGKPAADFMTDDSIRNTFKTLEIEVFKEVS